MKTESSPNMPVLLADDEFTSRTMLEAFVKAQGFEPTVCSDGAEAWDCLQKPDAPSLIILDWMMPELNGLDVCRKVKAQSSNTPIYIIMLTGLDDKAHLVEALDAGANDYITKPFDHDELRARLSVAKRVLDAESELVEHNTKLERLVEDRAQQLVQAEKLATIGTMSAGIAHEINNPATFIAGNVQVLDQVMTVLLDHLGDGVTEDKTLAYAIGEVPKIVEAIRKGVTRIENITNGLKTYSRKSSTDGFGPVDLEQCIDSALELCNNKLKYNVTINRSAQGPATKVWGTEQELVQVLVNLFVNAADAMSSLDAGDLLIGVEYRKNDALVTVSDSGPGIKSEDLGRIFDPFFTTKEIGKGTGLGLSICRNIIQAHGGKLDAQTSKTGGATFLIHLPIGTDSNHKSLTRSGVDR